MICETLYAVSIPFGDCGAHHGASHSKATGMEATDGEAALIDKLRTMKKNNFKGWVHDAHAPFSRF